MTDPNSLNMIMQEMEHLHGDIKQIGYIVYIMSWFIWFTIISTRKANQ